MLPLIGTLLEAGFKVLDKVIPDPAAKAQAQLELLKLQQEGMFKELEADLERSKQQTDTNLEEAKSRNIFVAGWRPFIGWVCGSGFAIQFVVSPLCEWGSALAGHPIQFPQLDLSEMMPLLAGMLGLGTLRTYEKTKGVTK